MVLMKATFKKYYSKKKRKQKLAFYSMLAIAEEGNPSCFLLEDRTETHMVELGNSWISLETGAGS